MTARPAITPIRLVECDDGRAWDVPRRGCCRLCDRPFSSPATMPDDRLCAGCANRAVAWGRMLDLNCPLGRALADGEPPWHPEGDLHEQQSWCIDLRKPCVPLPEWARFDEVTHG